MTCGEAIAAKPNKQSPIGNSENALVFGRLGPACIGWTCSDWKSGPSIPKFVPVDE